MTDPRSPFRWAEFPRPSIFASDVSFKAHGRDGTSTSQMSSQNVDDQIARTGRSPGTIGSPKTKRERAPGHKAKGQAK